MRQMIFWVIMLVFNTSCATAQYTSSYDDMYTSNNNEYTDDESEYNVILDDDIALDENRQWHYDDYSVLGASNGQYVLLRGTDRYRYSLGALNYVAYSNLWGETIYERNCRPYYYNSQFGWFVYGNRCTYFVYPDGTYAIFRDRYYPRYYNYHYRYGHSRCLNIFSWHFWSGRHHRDYRGHCYDRPRYRHNDSYRSGRSSYGNSRSNSSYRNASTRSAETRRSSVNSTRTRSASGSNYQRSESSGRRSSSSYSQPSTRSRSEGSYSRSSSSSRPSSSYSRSSSGSSRSSSVSTRSSSGGSSRSSATRSEGSSRRR